MTSLHFGFCLMNFPDAEKISASKPAVKKSGLLVRKLYFTAEQSI
tara:strand:- start:3749 stop:3883 length:135 start_codon:yes stop_codon:yes gene_type:complete